MENRRKLRRMLEYSMSVLKADSHVQDNADTMRGRKLMLFVMSNCTSRNNKYHE